MELNKRVIVDTEFISLYLKGDLLTKQHVEHILTDGYLFTTTAITSSELLYGAYKKGWKEKKIQLMRQFLTTIGVIAFTYEHSLIYGKLRATNVKKGLEIGLFISLSTST